MMLTTKGRYAVMALVEVASEPTNKPVRLADIAKRQNISLAYLEQIFVKLKNKNVVASVKGPGGGYYLTLASDQISLEAIIDAVDENLKMTRCSENKACLEKAGRCRTHNLWQGLGQHIRDYFANISIGDIISGNNYPVSKTEYKK